MSMRDNAKGVAYRTHALLDRQNYCKPRNAVVKLNRCKKKKEILQG